MKSGSGVLDVEMYDCGNSVKRWNEKECVAVFCTVVEIPGSKALCCMNLRCY